jgi:hypothetical protein
MQGKTCLKKMKNGNTENQDHKMTDFLFSVDKLKVNFHFSVDKLKVNGNRNTLRGILTNYTFWGILLCYTLWGKIWNI